MVVKLECWGLWARERVGTEYPAVSCGFESLAGKGRSRGYLRPNDEDALRIERAIAKLSAFGQEGDRLKSMLVDYYVGQCSMAQIARKHGVGRGSIEKRLHGAEMFIAGELSHGAEIFQS